MNLQHALECITNSTAINKLDANIHLNDNITSSDIEWSKFGKLNIYSGEYDYYIDEISEFNGDLTLDAVNINSLQGKLKSLKINYNYSGTSAVNFEADTNIEELDFHTACLDRVGSNPSIINAIINDNLVKHLAGQTDVNLEGFLSKAANISRDASSGPTEHFMSLGYLTMDNSYNENWANVTINQTPKMSIHGYIVPAEFYANLVFHYTEYSYILDYINNVKINDDENYHDIVIPHSDALKAYLPDGAPELPVILGDYCFGGIGSKPGSEKDRHLYLTFDDTFIFSTDLDSAPRDDGTTVEIKESSRPFTENTFVARPGAIQKIHINFEKMRPETDKDPLNLYFSDFFTTVEKITNIEGTEDPIYNFTINQDDFNSYIEKLEGMVGGSENVIFNSPYEEIEAIIEAD